MDFFTAVPLPLSQAAESAPHPRDIVFQILKSFLTSEHLLLALAGLAIVVVLQVLAYWIAAKVVVGDPRGSFWNALRVWMLYMMIGFAFMLVLAVLIPILAIAGNQRGAIGVFGGASLLALGLVFLVPMRVFAIGFFKALGFLLLAALLVVAAQAGIQRAQGKPAFGRLPEMIEVIRSAPERERMLKQIASGKNVSPLEADLDRLASSAERAKPFPERQADLRKVYEALSARQKALPPGDAAALAEYDRLRAKYEGLIRVLQADFAASKGPPPAP